MIQFGRREICLVIGNFFHQLIEIIKERPTNEFSFVKYIVFFIRVSSFILANIRPTCLHTETIYSDACKCTLQRGPK
jgi:uncharacterized protein with PQ loop repeat